MRWLRLAPISRTRLRDRHLLGSGLFFCDMADEKKTGRKQIDWEMVEREYRAGKLSLREVARNHGCSDTAIRKRARTEGWSRDLSQKIDEEVRSKLVRSEVRTPSPTEKEIVEAVSARSADIITTERKDIQALRQHEEDLLRELSAEPTKLYLSTYRGQIVEKVVSLTVSERANTLMMLTTVRAKRIELERKVWGIKDADDDKVEPFVVQLSLQEARL